MPWTDEYFPRVKRGYKLPVVLSHEELLLFFDHIPGFKNRAALMTCYGAGLRISEAVALKVGDIDSKRKLIRVEQGKGAKDRYCSPGSAPCCLPACWMYCGAIGGPFVRSIICSPPGGKTGT